MNVEGRQGTITNRKRQGVCGFSIPHRILLFLHIFFIKS